MSDTPTERNESLSLDELFFANPHDRFARKTLDDPVIAGDLLGSYADPVVAKYVDLDHLTPDPTQYFSKLFKQVTLDVPYLTRLRDGSGEAEVLIVFEHKSRPTVFVVLQACVYVNLALYDRWIKAGRPAKNFKPPIPLMVVFYCGKEDWDTEIRYQDMFTDLPEELRQYVPQVRMFGINLNRYSYDNLPGRPDTQVVVESMKRAFDGTFPEHLESMLKRLNAIPLDERIEELIVTVCAYGVMVSDITEEQVDSAISNTIQGPKGIKMAETARESIWQKGVEVGEARGETKGKVETILTFLYARFKNVPLEIYEHLSKMTDPIALNSLAALAATCESVDEFAEALK